MENKFISGIEPNIGISLWKSMSHGESSLRPKLRTAKIPDGKKIPTAKNPTAKIHSAEFLDVGQWGGTVTAPDVHLVWNNETMKQFYFNIQTHSLYTAYK